MVYTNSQGALFTTPPSSSLPGVRVSDQLTGSVKSIVSSTSTPLTMTMALPGSSINPSAAQGSVRSLPGTVIPFAAPATCNFSPPSFSFPGTGQFPISPASYPAHSVSGNPILTRPGSVSLPALSTQPSSARSGRPSLSLNLSNLPQTQPIYLPSNVSTQSTPRGIWSATTTASKASTGMPVGEDGRTGGFSPRLKSNLQMLKSNSTYDEASTKLKGDSLMSTSKSTTFDSLAEVMSPMMSPRMLPSASSPEFMSPDSKQVLAVPSQESWTYPSAKHAEPTPGRDGKPYWHGVRLHGNTNSRLSSVARRREQLGQEVTISTLEDSTRPPASERHPSRCFDDLYADAVERHRRFKSRFSKLLEQEEARVTQGIERARQELLENQMRKSWKRDSNAPSPQRIRIELRQMQAQEQKLAQVRKELDACYTTTPVKRSRSASPKKNRSQNHGTETPRRSKSVGWSGRGSSLGTRSGDNKIATPSGSPKAGYKSQATRDTSLRQQPSKFEMYLQSRSSADKS